MVQARPLSGVNIRVTARSCAIHPDLSCHHRVIHCARPAR